MTAVQVARRHVETIEDLRSVLEGQNTISVPLRTVVPQGVILSVSIGEVFFSAGEYSADVRTRGCIDSQRISMVMKLDSDSTLFSFCSGREVATGDVYVLSRGSDVDHRVTGRSCHALVSLHSDSVLRQGGEDTLRLGKHLWGQQHWFRAPQAIRAATVRAMRSIVCQFARADWTVSGQAATQLQSDLVELFFRGIVLDESGRDEQYSLSCAQIVRKAEDWVDGQPPEQIQISDLCRALHLSRRTLQRAFTETLGTGPAGYLRRKRLKAARMSLRSSDPASTSVTDTAIRFGFWELGRFAMEYRRLFGESPSDTLGKRPAAKRRRAQ